MRIGILTFHRAHNYGAVLQCYALQEVLKSMGHEVLVIDYRQPFIEAIYSPFNFHRLKGLLLHPRGIYRYVRSISQRLRKRRIYTAFQNKHLRLTKPRQKNIPEDFERYVIGSDQLWGLHCLGGIADDVYLGNFKHKSQSKIMGYAISTNLNSLKALNNNGR